MKRLACAGLLAGLVALSWPAPALAQWREIEVAPGVWQRVYVGEDGEDRPVAVEVAPGVIYLVDRDVLLTQDGRPVMVEIAPGVSRLVRDPTLAPEAGDYDPNKGF